MSPLWTSGEIVAATGGRATAEFAVSGLTLDSRAAQAGDLFIALKDQRDGHDFVAAALAAGAAGALVSRVPDGVGADAPLVIVDDVDRALRAMGRDARARTAAKVIAVTGSAGKTSTKDMLQAALSAQGRTHVSQASFNNHWGVPLTLARMPQDADFAVIEIGMNHPGEIEPLARMAAPDVAIVTMVAPAHIAAFATVEDIAQEKAAIFAGLRVGGTAIFHAGLPVSGILADAARAAGARLIGFGEDAAHDWCARRVSIRSGHTVVEADAPTGPFLFKLAAQGRHFALNALAVLAAVDAVGADTGIAATDLGEWSPPGGRGAREVLVLDIVEDGLTVELIDDAYNANPASMAAGLEVLAAATPRDGLGRVAGGRRVAILGDMLELGAAEADFHAAIADLPQSQAVDVFHCVGPRMRHLWDALPPPKRGKWVETADDLVRRAASLIDAGDVILVKGSNSSKVSMIVDAIRKLGHAPGDLG